MPVRRQRDHDARVRVADAEAQVRQRATHARREALQQPQQLAVGAQRQHLPGDAVAEAKGDVLAAHVRSTELARVLKEFGEERFARRIAHAIVVAREEVPFRSTLQLAKVVAEANPAWEKHKHPATRTFQAIRIAVNNELGDLEAMLMQAARLLNVGGRLVIISFHSLEDRMVKQFMRRLAKGDEPPPGVPIIESEISRPFKVFSKALKPGKDEVSRNVRARSAVMRVMEKVSNEQI